MITKQTKEKPLEKASAKDDWKERIKQEVFTEFNQFKKEDIIVYNVMLGRQIKERIEKLKKELQ